jgi:hypothetical protein
MNMSPERVKKMKLGQRAAYLRRCIKAQELLEKYENGNCIRRRIFDEYIRSELNCSYVSYNNMINVHNPQRQLEEILNDLRFKV